ncbi:MAG: hypothetical protein J6B59_00020 [Alistipes sp.]|nr:hypothetical protein [Alistipes sp.]
MNKPIKHKESKWASAVNAFAERSKRDLLLHLSILLCGISMILIITLPEALQSWGIYLAVITLVVATIAIVRVIRKGKLNEKEQEQEISFWIPVINMLDAVIWVALFILFIYLVAVKLGLLP